MDTTSNALDYTRVIVCNEPDTFDPTGRPATPEQIEASDAAPGGLIRILEDGAVAPQGSWDEQNLPTALIWVD